MSTSLRKLSWLPPLSLVAIAFTLALVSFIFPLVPFAVTGQLALLLMLVRGFAYWPPLRTWLGSLPLAHRAVFALLLGAMALGHYSLNGRSYFPFVVWEIFPFVHEVDPVNCQQFIATTASGAKVRLLAEQQFPSIIQIDPVDSLSDATTEHLARALANQYNLHHASDPVREIDLVQTAVKLHPSGDETRTEPPCELLKHYADFTAPSH